MPAKKEKKFRKISIHFRLDPEVVKIIKSQENQTAYIEKLVLGIASSARQAQKKTEQKLEIPEGSTFHETFVKPQDKEELTFEPQPKTQLTYDELLEQANKRDQEKRAAFHKATTNIAPSYDGQRSEEDRFRSMKS